MFKKIALVFLMSVLSTTTLFSQGFQPPVDGKAVVYFVPQKAAGPYQYFHNDKYIGEFKGKNYFRYECDPGKQLLWASSENKEFIEADLKAGGIYVVMVENDMGAFVARVSLEPITAINSEEFLKIKAMVMKKAPVVTPQAKIDELNIRLKDFIAEKLNMYNTEWKQKYPYSKITPDMAIPLESLK
jgi:hypothetical protein